MQKTYHKRGETVHGFTVTSHPLYRTWHGMKNRCTNTGDTSYHNYGGRGIECCDRWLEFKNFALDMGLKPTPDHSLERIDNNKGYSPDNCVWATRTEQCINRRMFGNNTSGFTGVKQSKSSGRYKAVFDFKGERYGVGGTFETADEAAAKRKEVLQLFQYDKDAALKLCVRQSRSDSTTGVKGVSRHKDGRGFTARVTDDDKKRIYLGYFTSISGASEAIDHYHITGEKLPKVNKTWKQNNKS